MPGPTFLVAPLSPAQSAPQPAQNSKGMVHVIPYEVNAIRYL